MCPHCLDCLNPCDECQENIGVTPEETTPTLPPCTDGCVQDVWTDCVFTSNELVMCGETYPVGTTVSDLLEDVVAAVDCTNVPCDDIVKNIDYVLTGHTKELSYYKTLEAEYFTKSDVLTSISFNDNSSVTGDTLAYLKYSSLPTHGQHILTNSTIGSAFSMPIKTCADSLIGSSNEIWAEMLTSRTCFETKVCTLDVNRVQWSERWYYMYRSNPQMNDVPIINSSGVPAISDRGLLYINDTRAMNATLSNGSTIRIVDLNRSGTDSCEVITISGEITGGAPGSTQTNVWGNNVEYNYASSICTDPQELTNGHPALYFCTLGGVVCRLVRERNTECDERANWKTYIIAGANSTASTVVDTTGDLARFQSPYGLKKWYDINGEPSFLIFSNVSGRIDLIHYIDGIGGKNNAANWYVTGLNIPLAGVNANFNIEQDPTTGAPANQKRIWLLNSNSIKIITYTGALTATGTGDLTDPAEYNTLVQIHTSSAGTANVPGLGSVARVYHPSSIFRIDTNPGYYYLYTSTDPSPNCPTGTGFTVNSKDLVRIDEDPTLSALSMVDNYTFSKVINGSVITSTTPSEIGLFSTTANVRTCQGMFKDLLGDYYDITNGSLRLYDFGNSRIDQIVSGCAAYNDTTVTEILGDCDAPDLDSLDTQYELTLNC